MIVLDIHDINALIKKVGYHAFFEQLINTLEEDFKHWSTFDKCPRVANHVPDGVIELMPISNDNMYSFKYVNGHPKNPSQDKCTVMATGQLSVTETGEPLMFSEMTILTAFRTAATSAMAAKHLADKDANVLCLIGTGSQSEFQYLAYSFIFDLKEVRYFDTDPAAMEKFARNMAQFDIKLTPCDNATEAVKGADLITTCTADKKYQTVLTDDMITTPVFINALGGDCPGKTEIEKALVERSNIVVEYLPQSRVEGEIQQLEADFTCPELHQIINKEVALNVKKDGTIIYDSVGFALEDYSVLRLVYALAKEHNLGRDLPLIPELSDVKNLFSAL